MTITEKPGYKKIDANGYSILLFGIDGINIENDNFDIEVQMKSGKKYCATVYTLKNISRLMDEEKCADNPLNDIYFHDPSMIIVRDLSIDTILRTINDLIKRDSIALVMEEISD